VKYILIFWDLESGIHWSMAIFQKNEGYLGIDIGAHGIKLVELHKTKGRPQLWTYGVAHEHLDIHPSEPAQAGRENAMEEYKRLTGQNASSQNQLSVEDRIEQYAEILKQLLKETRATARRATASLPVSHVFHAIVTLPADAQKELDHHVKAKVKKMLPQPIENMQVVHQLIPDGKDVKARKYLRVLVTAAPKSLVSFYSMIFAKAGLQLEELETEAFALERSLIGHDQSTSMIIDIGAERTNLFIIDQGLPITHRSMNAGGNVLDALLTQRLGISEDMVGQMKKDLSQLPSGSVHTAIVDGLVSPIIKEISYGIELFSAQTGNEGKRLEKIVLTGGSALFPPVLEAIQAKFPVKVFIGDPWARVVYQQGLKQVLDELGPRMAVSIGLAMRNIV